MSAPGWETVSSVIHPVNLNHPEMPDFDEENPGFGAQELSLPQNLIRVVYLLDSEPLKCGHDSPIPHLNLNPNPNLPVFVVVNPDSSSVASSVHRSLTNVPFPSDFEPPKPSVRPGSLNQLDFEIENLVSV
jgi:hypothetical protein